MSEELSFVSLQRRCKLFCYVTQETWACSLRTRRGVSWYFATESIGGGVNCSAAEETWASSLRNRGRGSCFECSVLQRNGSRERHQAGRRLSALSIRLSSSCALPFAFLTRPVAFVTFAVSSPHALSPVPRALSALSPLSYDSFHGKTWERV